MLVGKAYALPDKRRLQLYLLNNILGGPGMNSRLNLALRERHGFSYSAESHFTPYTDTGAMMIYFSCDPERFHQSLQVTWQEIKKLRTRPINDNRLNHARKQLIGQLAISYESNEHLMLTTGKRFLVFNHVNSLDTIRKKLDQISAAQLMESAMEILDPENMNMLIFE
jgi:predicted Zn-dependent peptidase